VDITYAHRYAEREREGALTPIERDESAVDDTPAPEPNAAVHRLLHDFSLEMTGKDVPALLEARPHLPAGTRVNVTFLGNEDLDMRVSAAQAVRDNGLVPLPHLSARRLGSREELEEFLGRLRDVDATRHVFAVGGDPAEPHGPYPDALSLIRSGVLPTYGVREVSIAGYPEGHPDIATDVLWHHLEAKHRAAAEQGLETVILTQFGFDSDRVMEWVHDVRSRGITSPIRVGTPGPAGIKRLLGFARRFGIGANAMIVKKYGFSLTNLVGTAGPDRFVSDLADQLARSTTAGDVRLHFYAFGGLAATAEWVGSRSAERPPGQTGSDS
jgi:methylenetetrahydrofolate reductase (NADPH)